MPAVVKSKLFAAGFLGLFRNAKPDDQHLEKPST